MIIDENEPNGYAALLLYILLVKSRSQQRTNLLCGCLLFLIFCYFVYTAGEISVHRHVCTIQYSTRIWDMSLTSVTQARCTTSPNLWIFSAWIEIQELGSCTSWVEAGSRDLVCSCLGPKILI